MGNINYLSDVDLAILNCLMYIEINDKSIVNFIGYTIGEFVEKLISYGTENVRNEYMKKSELKEVIYSAYKNQRIKSYTIITGEEDKLGGSIICIAKGDYAVVVFKGTGYHEWEDNFRGGYLEDTIQQMEALKFVNSISENYNNIYVTGHSKGGNKAEYVTVLNDKICECVAFNSQGFSVEFYKKYKDKISTNKKKIKLIANSSDIVSALMYQIAEIKKYIKPEKNIYVKILNDNLFYEHNMNRVLIFDKDGKVDFRKEDNQERILIYLNKYTIYFGENASKKEKKIVLEYLYNIIEPLVNGKGILPDEVTLDFIKDTANTVYILDKYFKKFNLWMGNEYLAAMNKYEIKILFVKFLFDELEDEDLKKLKEYLEYISLI